MASDAPDDVFHFRGKTLTPESPRPLHYPEPSTIPVLENQMNPIFNDTSTHKAPQLSPEAELDSSRTGITPHLMEQYTRIYSMMGEKNDEENAAGRVPEENTGAGSRSALDPAGTQEITNETNISALQALLQASQTSSPVVHTQEAPAGAVSTPGPINHAGSSGASRTEPDPPFNPAEPIIITNPEPLRENRDSSYGQTISQEPDGGINFQSLLDNICPPASTAQSTTDTIVNPPQSATFPNSDVLNAESPSSAPHNLPQRPPLPNQTVISTDISSATDDTRPFQNQHAQSSTINHPQSNLHSWETSHSTSSGGPAMPNSLAGSPTLPTPLQDSNPPTVLLPEGVTNSQAAGQPNETPDNRTVKFQEGQEDEAPWGPEIQKKYDEFLHDERIYVTEGVWDRFAPGSRLFVGNLPSERVTKRDLFHLFHKYGKLAQISIKPAYGFVQFMDATSCRDALNAEQDGFIRGRKIHLEISKPQRSSRHPESSKSGGSKRQRTPEIARNRDSGRGGRMENGRFDRHVHEKKPSFGGKKDRNRDIYRPTRSPVRGPPRDDYRVRDRSIERQGRNRRRSRSPFSPNDRFRNGPRANSFDSDAELPIPRRAPRHVPDVQFIVLENVDNAFVHHVETAFQNRGLRTDVLIISPRISLQAVIRRQIVEGVLAIVKLTRSNQHSGKVPLQVFDRGGGADNVRFNEYSGLEPSMAAEVALHARNIPIGNPPQPFQPSGLGIQPPAPPQAPPQNPPPNISNLISTLDGPALQSLLGALQQNPNPLNQQPYPPSNPGPANIANLLSNIPRQNPPVAPTLPMSQNPVNFQSFGQPAPPPPNNNLANLLSQGQLPHGDPAQAQYIMEQLAKLRQ